MARTGHPIPPCKFTRIRHIPFRGGPAKERVIERFVKEDYNESVQNEDSVPLGSSGGEKRE